MVTRTQAASTDFKLSYSSGVVDAHLSQEALLAVSIDTAPNKVQDTYIKVSQLFTNEFLVAPVASNDSFEKILKKQVDLGVYT